MFSRSGNSVAPLSTLLHINRKLGLRDNEVFLPTDDSYIETIVFTHTLVKAASKKLKIGGASGPDDFLRACLKNCQTVLLAEPLSLMFSSFMSLGKVPEVWKHALVTLVYKTGPASSVANYRPISLTCISG